MIYKTTTVQLQAMLEMTANEGREQDLYLNEQGWEYHLVNKVLRGISYVEDNQRKNLWIVWPLNINDLAQYLDFFIKAPFTINMQVIPDTGHVGLQIINGFTK